MTLVPTRIYPREAEDASEPADGLGEVPGHIPTPQGLTPARGALARHCAWIASVEGELAKLHTGQDKLRAQVREAQAKQAKVQADIAASAEIILGQVRSGLDWSLPAGKLDEGPSRALAVAETGLMQLDTEIARAERLLEGLQARKAGLVDEACHEAAAGLYEDYSAAAADLRQSIIALAGLETRPGAGSHDHTVAGWVPPGVAYPAPVRAHEVAASVRTWTAFRQALSEDPRADVNTFLKF